MGQSVVMSQIRYSRAIYLRSISTPFGGSNTLLVLTKPCFQAAELTLREETDVGCEAAERSAVQRSNQNSIGAWV